MAPMRELTFVEAFQESASRSYSHSYSYSYSAYVSGLRNTRTSRPRSKLETRDSKLETDPCGSRFVVESTQVFLTNLRLYEMPPELAGTIPHGQSRFRRDVRQTKNRKRDSDH